MFSAPRYCVKPWHQIGFCQKPVSWSAEPFSWSGSWLRDAATAARSDLPCLGLGPRWEGGGSVKREEGPCPAFGGGSDKVGAQTGQRHSWKGQSSVWVQLTHRDTGVHPPLGEPGTPPTGSSSKHGTPTCLPSRGGSYTPSLCNGQAWDSGGRDPHDPQV